MSPKRNEISLKKSLVFVVVLTLLLNVVLVGVMLIPGVYRNLFATTIGTNISTATLTATGSLVAPTLDTSGASTLSVGTSNASALSLSKSGATTTVNGQLTASSQLNLAAQTQLTIATGIVTATKSYHTVDTEAGVSSDDLNAINGGEDGDILVIRAANDSRTVVAKNNTGAADNLKLNGDFTMDDAKDTLTLIHDGSNWIELSRSGFGNIGTRVYNDAAISTTNNNLTALTFNTERYDTNAMHSAVAPNTGRITFNEAGTYMAGASVRFAQCGSGKRLLRLRFNGATNIAESVTAGISGGHEIDLNVNTLYYFSAGDYLEALVLQNCGTVDIKNDANQSPEFWAHKIAD